MHAGIEYKPFSCFAPALLPPLKDCSEVVRAGGGTDPGYYHIDADPNAYRPPNYFYCEADGWMTILARGEGGFMEVRLHWFFYYLQSKLKIHILLWTSNRGMLIRILTFTICA